MHALHIRYRGVRTRGWWVGRVALGRSVAPLVLLAASISVFDMLPKSGRAVTHSCDKRQRPGNTAPQFARGMHIAANMGCSRLSALAVVCVLPVCDLCGCISSCCRCCIVIGAWTDRTCGVSGLQKPCMADCTRRWSEPFILVMCVQIVACLLTVIEF